MQPIKIKGIELLKGLNGAVKVIVELDGGFYGSAQEMAHRVNSSLADGKEWQMVLQEHKKKRSLSANAYCWTLIDKLAYVTGDDKVAIYKRAIQGIGGNSTIICVQDKALEQLCKQWMQKGLGWFAEKMPSKLKGCTDVVLYYGSSAYDTKQMSVLIDRIVQDCKAVGIETLPDYEIRALLEKEKEL